MKCDIPIELLSGYLDGELDKEQKEKIEKHLEECKFCKHELEELKQLDEYVRSMEVEEPSREFIFNLNRRVMGKIKKKSRFFLFRISPVLVPVTVALLVLIVLIKIYQPSRFASSDDRIFYMEIEAKKDLDIQIPEFDVTREDVARGRGVVEEKKITAEKIPAKKKIVLASPDVPSATKAADIEATKDLKEAEHVAKGGAGEMRDEVISTIAIEELQIPQDRIVRAIIDSTGKVVKVATGNTIIPEKDTMLENRLQGQQLKPATVAGRRAQIYVDLTQRKETQTETKKD